MSMYSLTSGVRSLVYAYRRCDDREHFECADGHPNGITYEDVGNDIGIAKRTPCRMCGGEVMVRPERSLVVKLALQEIRNSLVPYTLTEWSSYAPTVEATTYWRKWPTVAGKCRTS